jgi:hypothetical protein
VGSNPTPGTWSVLALTGADLLPDWGTPAPSASGLVDLAYVRLAAAKVVWDAVPPEHADPLLSFYMRHRHFYNVVRAVDRRLRASEWLEPALPHGDWRRCPTQWRPPGVADDARPTVPRRTL